MADSNSQPKQARVGNAADRKQLKDAKRTERDQSEQELFDIKEVLSTGSGKRLLWRVLVRCKTFSSVYAPDSLISYNSGQQDIGHFLLDEITRANPDALLQMMKDHQQEKV